jgi:hypothetical protein
VCGPLQGISATIFILVEPWGNFDEKLLLDLSGLLMNESHAAGL